MRQSKKVIYNGSVNCAALPSDNRRRASKRLVDTVGIENRLPRRKLKYTR